MTAQQSNPDNATTTGQDALWLHEEQVRYARMADEKRTEFRRMVHEQRDWFDAYLGQLLESDRET